MRIIVTGGAGFIGSHLTDALLEQGDEVWIVDDLSTGQASRLHEKAVLVEQSIVHAEALAALVEDVRPELICHLAAQIDVRASTEFPVDDACVNVIGTINVLGAARRAEARVLFCSSGGALYGQDAPIRLRRVSPMPESPYGAAKYCARAVILHGQPAVRHLPRRAAARRRLRPAAAAVSEAAVIPRFCSRALRGERACHLRRWQADPRFCLCQ